MQRPFKKEVEGELTQKKKAVSPPRWRLQGCCHNAKECQQPGEAGRGKNSILLPAWWWCSGQREC